MYCIHQKAKSKTKKCQVFVLGNRSQTQIKGKEASVAEVKNKANGRDSAEKDLKTFPKFPLGLFAFI